jgi:CheY-like chemotaxis protein
VLLADDDVVARKLASGYLARRFDLCEVASGTEALDAFDHFRPDLILLDIDMPGMNGSDTAAMIRFKSADQFVPILLISGLEDQGRIAEGISKWADDFIPKPFNPKLFQAKVTRLLRFRTMQENLRHQNELLRDFRQRTNDEHTLAREIFDRIGSRVRTSDPRVRSLVSPLAGFNGDIALTATTPSGAFRLVVADVTGHGLSAAVGTIPLASLFLAETNRGTSLSDTIRRMNTELHSLLPARLFCAAVMVEIAKERSEICVCNAGMPDALLLRTGSTSPVSFASQNIPLGAISDFEPVFDCAKVTSGDRVLAMSDGAAECANPAGELIGIERLRETLVGVPGPEAFAALTEALRQFSGGLQSDDLTLIEVEI